MISSCIESKILVRILEYGVLDSTNDEAKRLVRSMDCFAAAATHNDEKSKLYGTVITAKRQTAGRGRLGKTFFSPEGDSIYASFILPPPDNPAEQLITALAAVAVCEAIEKTTTAEPLIKWVNDILVDGKKVCGILAETIPEAVVLGIGININIGEDCLPEDIHDIAGSLWMDETERACFEKALIESVLRCALAQCDEATSLMNIYRTRSAVLGKNIVLSKEGKERPAFVKNITDDGALAVEYEDNSVEFLRSSAVSIHLIEKD
jgi:BirA family biotin operon repressor/biotin-[acetyl-CoA-carboxylase] ligase